MLNPHAKNSECHFQDVVGYVVRRRTGRALELHMLFRIFHRYIESNKDKVSGIDQQRSIESNSPNHRDLSAHRCTSSLHSMSENSDLVMHLSMWGPMLSMSKCCLLHTMFVHLVDYVLGMST